MKKLYETILGLLSSLLILSSPAEAKKITKVSPEFNIPDIPKITRLDQISLIPEPSPLILKQADFDDDLFAGHRSHASHASHSSHRSHASHSSGSSSPITPSEEKAPAKGIVPQGTTTPSRSLPEIGTKEWQTTSEWVGQPCKLYLREVIINLKNSSRFQGIVTDCKDDSIQVKRQIVGSGEVKQWMNLTEINTLLWR